MEKSLRIELLEKRAQLEQIKDTLTKEFVGFDNLIESVIDKINSWYNFSHMQEQPRIINIWGAKNSGKLSLVKRLVQLLELTSQSEIVSLLTPSPEEETSTPTSLVTILKDFQFPSSEEMNKELHQRTWGAISKSEKMDKQPLIFILGDINSVYLNITGEGMTGSINADKLKELLQLYFTREQIALLGEHHLIIPSLTAGEINQLISNRVEQIHDTFMTTYGVPFLFDVTVPVFIYNQFIRSRNQTGISVSDMIDKHVFQFTNEVLTEAAIHNIAFDTIQIRESNGMMIADYVREQQSIYQFKYQFIKKLSKGTTAIPAPEVDLSKRVWKSTPKFKQSRLSA